MSLLLLTAVWLNASNVSANEVEAPVVQEVVEEVDVAAPAQEEVTTSCDGSSCDGSCKGSCGGGCAMAEGEKKSCGCGKK